MINQLGDVVWTWERDDPDGCQHIELIDDGGLLVTSQNFHEIRASLESIVQAGERAQFQMVVQKW